MLRRLSLLFGSTALAATLSLTATAQEYSNGGPGGHGRGPAIVTPVEDYGVHPPGVNAPGIFHRVRKTFTPYYAPLSPTPTFLRWRVCCYFPLVAYYTPYYKAYSPHRLCNPEPPPYGYDQGWGQGPMPCADAKPGDIAFRSYGAYTSILKDDTLFWNMGGNGLVPYGAPRPPHEGPPDLVDSIQATRRNGGNGGGSCSANGTPFVALSGRAGPAILPPTEKPVEQGDYRNDKETSPTEKEPPQ